MTTKFNINTYLDKENSICREERQYALFLYNNIKNEKKEILDKLSIKGNIVDIYFEVSLMRDFWYENKIEFNRLLKEYVNEEFKDVSEFKIGLDEGMHANGWEKKNCYAIKMMNAKPDIGFITYYDSKYRLYFIECKYESIEGTYTCTCGGNCKTLKQTEVQEYILDFISKNFKYINQNQEESLLKGDVIKVKFYSGKQRTHENGYINIDIRSIM